MTKKAIKNYMDRISSDRVVDIKIYPNGIYATVLTVDRWHNAWKYYLDIDEDGNIHERRDLTLMIAQE